MVEHQGAVGLCGGMYIATQHRKDTCTDTPAQAEVSYLHPTSLRFYTPEVHPSTPVGNFFEYAMRGNMRYDILPLPTPRRLSTTQWKFQPTTSDHDLRGHWIGFITFGLTWVAIGCAVEHLRGGDDARTFGPHWDPAGQVPFREFVHEVHAWINVTTGYMTPVQPVAALQR
eukprot:9480783-Pyramimonas_sp.AAC.1